MLSKIRLHAKGELPQEYVDFLGDQPLVFDWRCVTFLGVDYGKLTERTLEGGTDEEVLEWAFQNGRKPTDQEIEIWNGFMPRIAIAGGAPWFAYDLVVEARCLYQEIGDPVITYEFHELWRGSRLSWGEGTFVPPPAGATSGTAPSLAPSR